MKAQITIIDDYGFVIERGKYIEPVNEFVETIGDGISTKTTVFQFNVKQMYVGGNKDEV